MFIAIILIFVAVYLYFYVDALNRRWIGFAVIAALWILLCAAIITIDAVGMLQ